jgi:predicted RNase H-like nuclease
MRTVGVDGCRSGWIAASATELIVTTTLRVDSNVVVGIDMPIGLSDDGPRACDIEARRFLGRRGSSVFPAPPRSSLTCTNYQSALATARSTTGRGISVQTFNIIAKIAELDRLISPVDHDRVVEIHPECSFKMLNDSRDLPPKRTPIGKALRRKLLTQHFKKIPSHAPHGAAIDDVYDAYAVLWSATRFARGDHHTFGDGGRDARGLEMRIVC